MTQRFRLIKIHQLSILKANNCHERLVNDLKHKIGANQQVKSSYEAIRQCNVV